MPLDSFSKDSRYERGQVSLPVPITCTSYHVPQLGASYSISISFYFLGSTFFRAFIIHAAMRFVFFDLFLYFLALLHIATHILTQSSFCAFF